MKLDIVNVFGTGFVQADERHPEVVSFQQSVGEKSIFPITIQPIDTQEYLTYILATLQINRVKIAEILSTSPTVEQVKHLREYYRKENQNIPVVFTGIHETIDKKVDDMVDALVGKYSQNILVNQASKPISLVRNIKNKIFIVVTGNFCAQNGCGEFSLKEFFIDDIQKTHRDESMNLGVETLDLKLQKIIKGQGVSQYNALVKAYEREYQVSIDE